MGPDSHRQASDAPDSEQGAHIDPCGKQRRGDGGRRRGPGRQGAQREEDPGQGSLSAASLLLLPGSRRRRRRSRFRRRRRRRRRRGGRGGGKQNGASDGRVFRSDGCPGSEQHAGAFPALETTRESLEAAAAAPEKESERAAGAAAFLAKAEAAAVAMLERERAATMTAAMTHAQRRGGPRAWIAAAKKGLLLPAKEDEDDEDNEDEEAFRC